MNSHRPRGRRSRTSRTGRRALALQGPTSRAILAGVRRGADVASLKYFRVMPAQHRAAFPVEISRTGYTGDLGYEIWVDADAGEAAVGRADGGGTAVRHHAHRHAGPRRGAHRGRPHPARRRLRRRRKKALIALAAVLAVRDRPGPAREPRQGAVHRPGRAAPRGAGGPARQLVGLDVDWDDLERLHDEVGPAAAAPAHRVAACRCPVYRDGDAGGQGHEQHVVADARRR